MELEVGVRCSVYLGVAWSSSGSESEYVEWCRCCVELTVLSEVVVQIVEVVELSNGGNGVAYR